MFSQTYIITAKLNPCIDNENLEVKNTLRPQNYCKQTYGMKAKYFFFSNRNTFQI